MSHREKDERQHTNKKPEFLFMIKALKKNEVKQDRAAWGPTLDLVVWEGTGELRPGGGREHRHGKRVPGSRIACAKALRQDRLGIFRSGR